MKEAAAEECAAQCKALGGPGKAAEATSAESYDACYAKCLAQETKEIAAERREVCPRRVVQHDSAQAPWLVGSTLADG